MKKEKGRTGKRRKQKSEVKRRSMEEGGEKKGK